MITKDERPCTYGITYWNYNFIRGNLCSDKTELHCIKDITGVSLNRIELNDVSCPTCIKVYKKWKLFNLRKKKNV